MLYILYTFIIFSLNATPFFDQEMKKNKDFFDQQKYEEALNGFSDLNKKAGGRNSALLFNIGNCYFKMGKYGYARAYYLKASSISPRDEDVSYNLSYINSILSFPEDSYYTRVLSFFSIDEISIAVITFIVLFSTFLIILFRRKKGRRFFLFMTTLLFFILFLLSLLLTIGKITKEKDVAVLLIKNSLRAAPTDFSTILVELQEGVLVRVREENNDWFRVSFKDEYSGWIKKEAVMELKL